MKVHVLPKPGRTVLLPGLNLPLAPEGTVVEYSAHWVRRMLDGDIEVRELEQAATATPAAPPPAAIETQPADKPRESTRRKP
jgi:hypothetical protein